MPQTLTTSCTLPSSLEKIFSKYSDPVALARWWGPHGFTNTFEIFDFTPGGRWVFTMHSSEGQNYPNEHIFHKVEKNHIIMEHIVEPRFTLEVLLEEIHENETKMTWNATFENAEFLEKMRNFLIEKNRENFERLTNELSTY